MEFMQKYSNEISDEDENEDGDDKSSALDHVVKRDTPDQAAGNWDGAVEGTDRAGNAQIPIVGLQKCQWIESDEEDSDAEDVCQHGVYRDKEFIKQSFLSSSGSDVLSAKEIFDLEIPPPKYLSACSSKSAELASFNKVEQRPQPKQTGSVQSKKSKPETVSVAQRAMNDALFNQLQKQRPSKLAARTNDKETVKVGFIIT